MSEETRKMQEAALKAIELMYKHNGPSAYREAKALLRTYND